MTDCSCQHGDPIGCLVHSPLASRNQNPTQCPDCLALAKWMRDMASSGRPYYLGLDAFIKEREK